MTQELYQAKLQWVKSCQLLVYGKEILNLMSSFKRNKRLTLIRQLHLLLDNGGLLCCVGRIHNAPLSQIVKFPYLLPPKHHL